MEKKDKNLLNAVTELIDYINPPKSLREVLINKGYKDHTLESAKDQLEFIKRFK